MYFHSVRCKICLCLASNAYGMHMDISAVFLTKQGKRRRVAPPFPYYYEPICKPGSVLTVIYLGAPLPVRSSHPGDGRASQCPHTGVAPDRVYSDGHFRAIG